MFLCDYINCNFKIHNVNVIKTHVVLEHGIAFRNRFKFVNSGNSKKRGQTVCSHCQRSHNNRARSNQCTCGHDLLKVKNVPQLSVYKLYGNIFSVRKNIHGICKRVIVDLENKVCFSVECFEARSNFANLSNFMCVHLKACNGEIKQSTARNIKICTISKYISDENTLKELDKYAVQKKLTVYEMADNQVALSVLKSPSHQCISGLIHIDLEKLKCPIQKCHVGSKSHSLVKAQPMCIHILICKLIFTQNMVNTQDQPKEILPQFDKQRSVKYFVEELMNVVPSPLEPDKEKNFLQNSYQVQMEVLKTKTLSKYECKFCNKCGGQNIVRNKRPDNCFLVTPGFIIEIKIKTFVCKKCNIVYYPKVIQEGLVPISDKLIVSWSYLVDGRNQLQNGTKMYNYFKSSLRRLSLENSEIAGKIDKIDYHNLAIKLCKCAIAYNSASLIRCSTSDDSLLKTLCLQCGIIPLILSSDGNAKNSIFLNRACDNLVYDKEDSSEMLSLGDFLTKCVISSVGSAMFQGYVKEKINVYKIPPVISKTLCTEARNRELLKKSVFMKKIDLSTVDFNEVTRIFESGEFDLLKSRALDLKTVRKLAKQIRIPSSGKQSKIMLENIILELFEHLVGGSGNCHQYMHNLGETGGWCDSWCPHNFKYGSKIMMFQESVVDPGDIFLSLKFPPALQILDDPCTFTSHLVCTEPELSKKILGENKGCFEPPHKTNLPKSNHDCPELLPLSHNPRKVNLEALNNPSESVHPTSGTVLRKVLGTKLSDSHRKNNECGFHNINLCLQAAHIKTMSQEGLQMRRKAKRVTPGKRQTFENHYLFNFLLDVLENFEQRKKQEKQLSKHGNYVIDPISRIAMFM